MIAYASVYGNTENAANILACRLAEQGIRVKMYDVSVTPSSYVVSDAFRYSHLVFAAPTYNGGVFITLEVRSSNVPAIALYRSLGFTEVGVRRNFYTEPREDAVIFTLSF